MASVVQRDEVGVMFLRTEDTQEDIQRGWARMEALVSTRGRKFYGAFDNQTREYRVCVALQDGDDPEALGLERGTLPGGSYLRERLRGEPPEVYGRIAPTFTELMKTAGFDETRPNIEYYRQRDEIDLLLPVAG